MSSQKPFVRRTPASLGFTDNTLTTRQTRSNVSAYDLSKALFMDQIEIEGNATVGVGFTGDNLQVHLDMPMAIGSWYFYSTDASGNEISCDSWMPEMYLVGTALNNGNNAFSAAGCSVVTLGGTGWNLARRFNSAGELFSNEFRPGYYIDSIVVDLPLAYDLNAVNINTNDPGNGLGTSVSLNNVTPAYTDNGGTRRTYINPNNGLWKHPNITVNNIYGNNILVSVTPTCASSATVATGVKVYLRDFYYAYANVATGANPATAAPAGLNYILSNAANPANPGVTEPNGQSRNIIYTSSGRPTLSLQNLTGTINATAAQHEWTLRISNTGTNSAPYVWIAIPNHAINVIEVRDAANSVLTAFDYSTGGGGKMYRLVTTPGIAQGSSRDLKIRFTYNDVCTASALPITAGWNCGSFPADPSSYTCGTAGISLGLNILAANVQLSISRQPGGGNPVSMCSTDYTDIVLNSAQASYLVDPKIEFEPPAGINISGSASIEYPLGSGAGGTQSVPVIALGNNRFRILLTAHTAIGTAGIPGTTDALNNNYRQAVIRVGFETNCAFSSGSSFGFRGYGKRPCGDDATGNGTQVTTNPLQIAGASVTGGAGTVMGFGGATMISCHSAATLTSSITPTSAGSTVTDTVVYTLPAGMVYAGNPTNGFNPQVSNNTVKVGMPTASAGTTVSFSFQVSANGGGCGSGAINATYNRQINGLTCNGSSCTGSSAVVATGSSGTIAIQMPDLRIGTVVVSSGAFRPGSTYTADVTLINNTNLSAMPGDYALEAFCGAATTPFATVSFGAAIPANGNATASLIFPVPNNAPCVIGSHVSYKIRPVTSGNVLQCLCTEASYSYPIGLSVQLLRFQAEYTGRAVQLTWAAASDQSDSGYGIEHSVDGVAWQHLGFVHQPTGSASGVQQEYRYTHVHPASGKNYYRLVQMDDRGDATYSPVRMLVIGSMNAVRLYPNPVTDFIHIEGVAPGSEIRLYDIAGRLISGQTSVATYVDVPVQQLCEGSYRISISDGNGTLTNYNIVK